MIREAVMEDGEELALLIHEVESESPYMLYEAGERDLSPENQSKIIDKLSQEENSAAFLAEREGRLVGYLFAVGGNARKNKHSVHIVIGIRKNYRGLGVGTELFKKMEDWASKQKIHRLELTVIEENLAGVKLYKKSGFEIEGKKRDSLYMNGRFVDEYYMSKLWRDKMTNLISVQRLKNRLANNQNNTAIIDLRFQLDDPDAGRRMYLKDHLPGAVYMDLNKDLSGKVEKHGGSHPLPDWTQFTAKIGNIGIDNQTTVVIYDQGNEMFAARLWWLLETIGHDNVYILEGGYNRWVEEGNEVTDEIPSLEAKEFKAEIAGDRFVKMQDVKEKMETNDAVLIDSRARERYLGEWEPLYSKAGHIPGAKNYFWKDVFSEDGIWKKGEVLEEHFSNLSKKDEIIVSCGSGISACPNILALKMAGFKNVKLYPGSFSDWISYDENEVELEEN
ncbi:GNAT family N-acetyltransferase [Oceanobacillus damuensis]|uniref:GNAT family N-acetyltransferase n=1 Tax=Oceanobacillus damuensis TaxID=937928 RepID=UPI000A06DB5D|nr:GNAT family N-acetyltransferase [Oceanobacillus damuensis]